MMRTSWCFIASMLDSVVAAQAVANPFVGNVRVSVGKPLRRTCARYWVPTLITEAMS